MPVSRTSVLSKAVADANSKNNRSRNLRCLNLEWGGKVIQVVVLEKPFRPLKSPEGLSASADGRWMLYTQQDRAGMDIMFVENCH